MYTHILDCQLVRREFILSSTKLHHLIAQVCQFAIPCAHKHSEYKSESRDRRSSRNCPTSHPLQRHVEIRRSARHHNLDGTRLPPALPHLLARANGKHVADLLRKAVVVGPRLRCLWSHPSRLCRQCYVSRSQEVDDANCTRTKIIFESIVPVGPPELKLPNFVGPNQLFELANVALVPMHAICPSQSGKDPLPHRRLHVSVPNASKRVLPNNAKSQTSSESGTTKLAVGRRIETPTHIPLLLSASDPRCGQCLVSPDDDRPTSVVNAATTTERPTRVALSNCSDPYF